jgi:hypothetical protein
MEIIMISRRNIVIFMLITYPLSIAQAKAILEYSTYLGGRYSDQGRAAVVDANGYLYIAGLTGSPDLPATEGAYSRDSQRSLFIAKLSPDGTKLEYLTYFGGRYAGSEFVQGIAVDKDGCVYLAGNTKRSDFPTTRGAYDRTYKGSSNQWHGDGFVAKLSADGSKLIYSTFIGGSGAEVLGKIAVDEEGCAYACFLTSSTDFPTTEGAFDRTYNGGEGSFPDSAIIKLSRDGSELIYSTYLGGGIGEDSASAINVDQTGCVTVSGTTSSPDFPVTEGAFDTSYNGGESDIFITKLNALGSELVYSTFLGGTDYDGWPEMTLDPNGTIYIAAQTRSVDYPVTANTFGNIHNGGQDIAVSVLSGDASTLKYSMFLGGSSDDSPGGLALDSRSNIVLTGYTESRNFPVTDDAFQGAFKGISDVVLCQINTALSELSYSTLLGGLGQDVAMDLMVDSNEGIWVAGFTNSTNFPTTVQALDQIYNGPANPAQWVGDAFAAKFVMNVYDEDEPVAGLDFIRGQSMPTVNSENLAVADLDGDDDMDIFLVCGVWNAGMPNRVYFNQGDGAFVDSGQRLGNLNSFGVALADLDDDGDIDAFVANGAYSGGNPNKVWLNDGTGQFTDSGQSLGHNNTGAVALADLDGDGDLDAFAGNHPIWQNNRNVGGGHCIWFNDGKGRFTNSGQSLGNAESRSVSLGDIDGDGDIDALIGNYINYGNKLWLNDGQGYFTEGIQRLGTIESREALLADLDGDGDLDAFVSHFSNQNPVSCANKVWFNQGNGTFLDSGQCLGQLPTAGIALGDLDLDGDLDAFVINSVWQETRPDEVWLNDEQGYFTDIGLDLGNEESVDVGLADLDGDGDLDALVVTPQSLEVFINMVINGGSL